MIRRIAVEVVVVAVISVLLGLLGTALTHVAGRAVNVWALAAVVGVVLLTGRAGMLLDDRPVHDRPRPDDASLDRAFERLLYLRQHVGWATESATSFDRTLRPLLLEIAEDRARRHHGVELRDNSQAGEQLLGAPLWAALHTPARTPADPALLKALVERLETL